MAKSIKGAIFLSLTLSLFSWIGKKCLLPFPPLILHWLQDSRTTVWLCISYCKVQNFILTYIVGDVTFHEQYDSWSATLLRNTTHCWCFWESECIAENVTIYEVCGPYLVTPLIWTPIWLSGLLQKRMGTKTTRVIMEFDYVLNWQNIIPNSNFNTIERAYVIT